MEAFSDAVFGFALTLVVVSLETPKTVDDLLSMMRGVPAFAICFAALLNLWWIHNRFFRRYGLADMPTFLLNSALLFVVLIYVYPLKFIWTLFFSGSARVPAVQGRLLFLVYSGGFAAVFLLIAAMHVHAWRRRRELQLSPAEELITVECALSEASKAGIGVLSILIALLAPAALVQCAGWVYALIPIPLTIIGNSYGKRSRLAAAAAGTPP